MKVIDKNGNEVRIGDTVEFKSWAGGLKTPVLREGLVLQIRLYDWWRDETKIFVKLSVLSEQERDGDDRYRGVNYIATITNFNNIRVINF
jgi:hypothetical protein